MRERFSSGTNNPKTNKHVFVYDSVIRPAPIYSMFEELQLHLKLSLKMCLSLVYTERVFFFLDTTLLS